MALSTACSKDASTTSASITTPSTTLSGIAATGAPVSGGAVEIKGSNGQVAKTKTDSTGAYGASVTNLTSPYLIKVTTPNGEKLISVGSDKDLKVNKKVNVTPLTHTIVANVFGEKNADTLFDSFEAQSNEFSDEKVTEQKTELVAKLSAVLGSLGVPTSIDLMGGDFVAGSGNGIDKLLDSLDVNLSSSTNIEIKIKGYDTPIISDSVTTTGEAAPTIAPEVLTIMNSQITALAQIKAFYKSLSEATAANAACSGPAVSEGPCSKTVLKDRMIKYFHTDYLWSGRNQNEDVWSAFCLDTYGKEPETAEECAEIIAENFTFTDLTVINYDSENEEALVSFNVYSNGKLEGFENERLKKEGGAWKSYGNQNEIEAGLYSQNIFRTTYTDGQKADVHSAEMYLHADVPLDATLITLRAVGNKSLDDAMDVEGLRNLVLIDGHLVFSSRKYVDATNGGFSEDDCTDPDTQTFCFINNQGTMTFAPSTLALMNQKQKFTLHYTSGGAKTAELIANKPFMPSSTETGTYMPDFTDTNICEAKRTEFSVTVPTGINVEHGYAQYHFHQNSSYVMYYGSGSIEDGKFIPQYQNPPMPEGLFSYATFTMYSRDTFERNYNRIIECRNSVATPLGPEAPSED